MEKPSELSPGKEKKNKEIRENVQVRNDGKDLVSITEGIVNVCLNFKALSNPKAVSSTSRSKSSQVLGLLKGKNVFLKIFSQNSITNNGPIVEGAIYVCAISKLIQKSCPFFIQPLAYQECDGFINRLIKKYYDSNDLDPKDILESIINKIEGSRLANVSSSELQQTLLDIHPENERSYIIINEQLGETDVTLSTWLETPHSLESYQAVYFEIFWTLLCMEKLGLRHNDLHTGNIYVRNLKEERVFPFRFKSNKKTYDVFLKTRYKVLIYDFDRSTIIGLTDNTFLQTLCDKGWGCQTENFGYDLTKLICYSYNKLLALSQSKQFLELIFKNPQIGETYSQGIAKTIEFISGFFNIQGKDFSKVSVPTSRYGEYCVYPPKDVLLSILKIQKYPNSFVNDLKFLKNELVFDFDYAKILATNSFFESIRNFQIAGLKNVVYDKTPTVTYSVPNDKLIKEIYTCIREQFPQIVYRPPISISVESK